jgi:hypothetical protein
MISESLWKMEVGQLGMMNKNKQHKSKKETVNLVLLTMNRKTLIVRPHRMMKVTMIMEMMIHNQMKMKI